MKNQDLNIQAPNIDLEKTTAIKNASGGHLFQQGVILRKVSKFILGSEKDAIMPIPVFYDPETLEIMEDSIPEMLREEILGKTTK